MLCTVHFYSNNQSLRLENNRLIFIRPWLNLLLLSLNNALVRKISKESEKVLDFLTLEINRLIRTNTFNKKICWNDFVTKQKTSGSLPKKKADRVESDYRKFRFSIIHESSPIKPYVNNRSSFKTTNTRSPMISLLYPTSEYMSFKL